MNKEIFYNGKKILHRVIGTGRAVMLVHGFGEDGMIWQQQVAALQNEYCLIVPDLPGSGASELTDDMSMEGMADVLKVILDNEIPGETAVMIGHSMGGYITLAFAEKYNDRLAGFGLFHSSAFADTEEKKAIRQKGIEFTRRNGAWEFFKTATPNLFAPVTKDERPELIDEQIGSLRNFSSLVVVKYYEAMMQRPDRTHVLEKTRLPVLFIMGKYDQAVPLADGLKQCHLPAKAYIHILKRSGHMGMLEEPGKSNEALKKYLANS